MSLLDAISKPERKFRIHKMPQRSYDWYTVRLGKVTGTSFQTMANGRKDNIEKLCAKTANEILNGISSESDFCNKAMRTGTETEVEARQAYEAANGVQIQEVGFVELDEFIGMSPDGLVDDDGGIELKCPESHTHLFYLINPGAWESSYKWQVQGALWITGREWWDFVSYCPLYSPDKQLLIERATPDPESFKKLADGAEYCRKRIREILKIMDENNGDENVQGSDD